MRTAPLLLLLAVGLASAAAPVLQDLTPGDKTAYIQLSLSPNLTDNVYTVRQTVGTATQFIESGSVPFGTGRTATVTYTKNLTPGNYTFTLLLSGTADNATWTINEQKAFSVASPAPTPTPASNKVDVTITAPSSGKRQDLTKDVTVSGTASHASGISKVWIAFFRGGGVVCTENKAWEGPITGQASWKYEWGLKSDTALGEVWDPGKYSILVKALANDGTEGCIEAYPFPVFGDAQPLANATPTPPPVDPNTVDRYCDQTKCVISFDATTNGSACWEDASSSLTTGAPAAGPCPIKGQVVEVGKAYEGKPTVAGKKWCVTVKEGGKHVCTDAVYSQPALGAATGQGCLPAPYKDQYGAAVQTSAVQKNNPAMTYTPQWHQGDSISCSFNANYGYVVTSVPGGVIYDTSRLLDAKRSTHFNFTIPGDSTQIAIEGSTSDQPGSIVTLVGATDVVGRETLGGVVQNAGFWVALVVAAVLLSAYRPTLFIPNEEEPSEPFEVGGATPVLPFATNGRNYHAFLAPFYLRKFPLSLLPGTGEWTLVVMELPAKRTKVLPSRGRLFRNIYTMPLPTDKGGQPMYPNVLHSKEGTKHFYDFPGYNGHAWHYVFAGQPKTQPETIEVDLNMHLKDTPEEQTNAKMKRLLRRGEEAHPAPKPAAPQPQRQPGEGAQGTDQNNPGYN